MQPPVVVRAIDLEQARRLRPRPFALIPPFERELQRINDQLQEVALGLNQAFGLVNRPEFAAALREPLDAAATLADRARIELETALRRLQA